MKPAYQEVRDRERREHLAQFLRKMVIPDNFTSNDAAGMALDDTDLVEAFCEHFGLGDWFITEMTKIDFDMYDFLVELESDLKKEEQQAAEDYRELQREYRVAQGGSC